MAGSAGTSQTVTVTLQLLAHQANGAASKELLGQLDAIRAKAEEMAGRLNQLDTAQKGLLDNASKRSDLQVKLLSGAGELATASASVVKNIAQLVGGSSEELNKALEKVQTVAETFKSAMDVIKASREVLQYLREYAATGAGAMGMGEVAVGVSGGGTAAKGFSMMLSRMTAQLSEAAAVAAPYAAVAAATVGLYESVVHVLGAMGAVDVSSVSLMESYRGWQEAAEAVAKSTEEISIEEEIRTTRAKQRKERAEQQSLGLDERYKMVDANRQYYETLGIGLDKNVPLQKFDEAALAEQRSRAEASLQDADAQKGKFETVLPNVSAEREKKYEEERPTLFARVWSQVKRAISISAAGTYGTPADDRSLPKPEMKEWQEEGQRRFGPRSLPAVPDYTTTIKEYVRLEQLQERGLEASKREYEVLRDKSKELQGQVRQSEELVRQARARTTAEQNRAESTVAGFARLDTEARKKIVSIAEKYKKTGKLSIEEARELDKYGIAGDLTNKTFAANATGPERAALEALGVFNGVDEAKAAEKKASEELTRAKIDEAKAGKQVEAFYQRVTSQALDLRQTIATISDLKEKQSNTKVDRSGLAGADVPKGGPPQAAGTPQAAVDFEKAFDSLIKDEFVPAILSTVNRAIAKLNNAA
jgi:hypothetical protein